MFLKLNNLLTILTTFIRIILSNHVNYILDKFLGEVVLFKISQETCLKRYFFINRLKKGNVKK